MGKDEAARLGRDIKDNKRKAGKNYWDVTRLDIDLSEKVDRKWLAKLQASGAHIGAVLDARPDIEDVSEVQGWIRWHELPYMPAPPKDWQRATVEAAAPAVKAAPPVKERYKDRPLSLRRERATARMAARQPATLASSEDKLKVVWLLLEGGAPVEMAARAAGVDGVDEVKALAAWHNMDLRSVCSFATEAEVAAVEPLNLHQVEVLATYAAEVRAWLVDLPLRLEAWRGSPEQIRTAREKPIISHYHAIGYEVSLRRWRQTAALCGLHGAGVKVPASAAILMMGEREATSAVTTWSAREGRLNKYQTRRLWRYISALEAAPYLTYTGLCDVLALQIKSVGEAVRTFGLALEFVHKPALLARPHLARDYNKGVII